MVSVGQTHMGVVRPRPKSAILAFFELWRRLLTCLLILAKNKLDHVNQHKNSRLISVPLYKLETKIFSTLFRFCFRSDIFCLQFLLNRPNLTCFVTLINVVISVFQNNATKKFYRQKTEKTRKKSLFSVIFATLKVCSTAQTHSYEVKEHITIFAVLSTTFMQKITYAPQNCHTFKSKKPLKIGIFRPKKHIIVNTTAQTHS